VLLIEHVRRLALVSLLCATSLARGAPSIYGVPLEPSNFRLVSLRTGGDVNYDMLWNRADNGSTNQLDRMGFNVRSVASGFYWRPWFGLWNTSASLYMAYPGLLLDVSGVESGEFNLDGGLQLFHESRFPFKLDAFYRRRNNQTRLFETRPSGESVGFSVDQSYQTLLGDQYRGRFRHTLTRSGLDDEINFSELHGEAALRIDPRQDLFATFTYNRNDRSSAASGTDALNQAAIARANHNYLIRPDLRLDSFSYFNHIESDLGPSESFRLDSGGVSSSLSWRPANRPLTARSAFFANASMSEDAGGQQVMLYDSRADANVVYDYSPDYTFDGGVLGSFEGGDRSQTTHLEEFVGARYHPRGRQFYGFNQSWGGSGRAVARQGDRIQNKFSVSGNGGESLNRTWRFMVQGALVSPIFSHDFRLRLRQEEQDGSQAIATLTHDLSASWFRSYGLNAVTADVNLHDSRDFVLVDDINDELDRNSQRLMLRTSLNRSLGRGRSVNGNFNVTFLAGSHVVSENSRNANLSINYNHANFLQVSRLILNSRLIAISQNDFYPDFGTSQDNTLSWVTELDYFIGRLEIDFELRLDRRNGQNNMRALLKMTRHFGS